MRELIDIVESVDSENAGISRNQLAEVIRVAIQDECMKIASQLAGNKGNSFAFNANQIDPDTITDAVLTFLNNA